MRTLVDLATRKGPNSCTKIGGVKTMIKGNSLWNGQVNRFMSLLFRPATMLTRQSGQPAPEPTNQVPRQERSVNSIAAAPPPRARWGLLGSNRPPANLALIQQNSG